MEQEVLPPESLTAKYPQPGQDLPAPVFVGKKTPPNYFSGVFARHGSISRVLFKQPSI